MSRTRCLVFGMLLIGAPLFAQSSAQWSKQAQEKSKAASKIGIEPPEHSPKAGHDIELVLRLLNDKDEHTPATADTPVQVQMTTGAGQVVQSKTCVIPAKSTHVTCHLGGAPSGGVFKVRAIPQNRELLDATQYLQVRASKDAPKKAGLSPYPYSAFGVRIVRTAYYSAPEPELEPEPPQPASRGCEDPASRGPARVIVEINDGGESGGAFRAGKDSATITAFFQADDGGSAPAPITVWLSQDHGEIEEKPLVIKACKFSGATHLKSAAAAEVSVRYHVFPESYQPRDGAILHASFITPIAGIGILPSAKQVMSLIDRAPLVAQFYDQDGRVIRTDIPRTVTFVSDNAVIGPKVQSVEVKPGKESADNLLLPYWVGAGSIYVTSEHLRNADPHLVQVTFLAVLLVCLVGSLLGGMVSFYKDGGKVLSRLLFGVAGGFVFAWIHISGLSRHLDWEIVHNEFSLLVFAILGGYLGVKALDLALNKLGWGRR